MIFLTSIFLSGRTLKSAACAVGLLAVLTSASAQSLRCNGDLASVGQSKLSVLQKCGEPLSKDSFCKPGSQTSVFSTQPVQVPSPAPGQTIIVNNACEQVEEWLYNPGAGQFMTTVRFEGGVMTGISYGDRAR